MDIDIINLSTLISLYFSSLWWFSKFHCIAFHHILLYFTFVNRWSRVVCKHVNPLKPQSNEPLYSNTDTVIGIHWPLMDGLLHLLQRGGVWAGCGPAQSPPRCSKCNSPSINGQCTNFMLFDVTL